jgi:anaerobic selenocysteine-containing dehydrogenase
MSLNVTNLLATLRRSVLASTEAATHEGIGSITYQGREAYEIVRSACPRNCYDTCGMLSYVQDGVLQFVEGVPDSTFTDGGLCVKGYTYPRMLYSPDRIKYPMRQVGRGSGNWRRVSWDEALDAIATELLDLRDQDGSMLGVALTKYSGNFGITHNCVEGMMTSLGYTTRFVGTPCWPAGIDAQNYDMGDMWCNDPEDMVQARYIILWGANPAYCSMHSMKYVTEAQRQGARVLVIDPVFTQTAAKADEYWEIRPGYDGALALGMARHLLDEDLVDEEWVQRRSLGYEEFADYLRDNVTVEWASEQAGLPVDVVTRAAEEFAAADPATVWIGYGMQRHVNGGQNVRAIDAFVAMTGNIGKVGGGVRYGQTATWGFNFHAQAQQTPEGAVGQRGRGGPTSEFPTSRDASTAAVLPRKCGVEVGTGAADSGGKDPAPVYGDRTLNINRFAQEILDSEDPPIRALWVSHKNPVGQDFDRRKILKALEKVELIVAVDLFFNETVEQADIVLPAVTPFEDWTVDVSYWHYWIHLNEQAVKPLFEARTDLEIAASLSARMNQRSPGSCTFPTEVDPKDWMVKEFNDDLCELFGIESWEDLRKGAHKARLASQAAWADGVFKTPSGKYEFRSQTASEHGHPALPVFKGPRMPYAPYRLLTPHHKFGLHSQFQNLDWSRELNPEPFVYLSAETAESKGIADGDFVRVFNQVGEQHLRARITPNLPSDTLLMYEAWYGPEVAFNVNDLVDDTPADMGEFKTGAPGVALHDQFADIEKA